VTVGWDLIILAGLIFLIEVQKITNWTYFFQVFGRNPLILYVLSGVVISLISLIAVGDGNLRSLIYETAYTSWLGPKNASFLFAISYMLLIWLIGFWMDKKRIYVKV
jgi:predicted acyltransferase